MTSRTGQGWTARGSASAAALAFAAFATIGGALPGCAPAPPVVALAPLGTPVVAPAPPAPAGPIRFVDGRLVDRSGREVLLHGVNVVRKSPPFIADLTSDLGPAEIDYLVNSGFNAVRLGVWFPALMPTPTTIDSDYLAQVVEVVDALEAAGLWVLLDFHQDVWWGLPDWAIPADARGLSDQPPEWAKVIGWAAGYLSPRSMRSWDSFLRGEPIAAGTSVAHRLGEGAAALADAVREHAGVIGIELLNEPFPGSDVVTCLLSGCPDAEARLAARYGEMSAPIRAAAPMLPIWAEPFAPTELIASSSLPPFAEPGSGPPVGLAWHLYCQDTDGGATAPSDPATAAKCSDRFARGLAAGRRIAARHGGPRMVDEFGASANPIDATLFAEAADREHLSWMYWHLAPAAEASTLHTDSAIPDEVEAQIVRAYAQATAGRVVDSSFDPGTGAFRLTYRPDPDIDARTAIALPTRVYPRGYDAVVTGGAITSSPQSGVATVRTSPGAELVEVRVTRR